MRRTVNSYSRFPRFLLLVWRRTRGQIAVVDVDVVYGWGKGGLLQMTNRAGSKARRPRWIITRQALAAFQASRQPVQPTAAAPRRRKRKHEPGFVEYY